MSRNSNVKAILIDERSILQGVQEVQASREDGSLTKTARDLLREYLMQLRLKGDPLAIRADDDGGKRQLSKSA